MSYSKKLGNYSIGFKLGNNNFSSTFQAINEETSVNCLVKIYKKKEIDSIQKVQKHFKRETSFILNCGLKNEYIAQILHTSMTKHYYYIFVKKTKKKIF